LVATGERIDAGDLPPEVSGAERGGSRTDLSELSWQDAVEQGRLNVAQEYIEAVLKRHDGNVAKAAAHAGVERESFYRLMRRYGFSK
jgi:two-component system response regulator HydG